MERYSSESMPIILNMSNYVRSLADPFDLTVQQPKFLDGRIDRSSGVRLRTTGTITCDTGGFTYICLFAGAGNTICWQTAGTTDGAVTLDKIPTPFTGYQSVGFNEQAQKASRTIAQGLKLQLMNSADESDGIWEAIRVPRFGGSAITPSNLYQWFLPRADFVSAFADVANNPTYQTGRLRDLHRYMFRTNYRNHELSFNALQNNIDDFDHVLIRIRGRTVSGQPSVLMYDTVNLVEIEYPAGTAISRLMTYNTVYPNMDEVANRINIKTPAIRIN